MLHLFIKGRVRVFIDAENTFYAQRTLGWRISYQRLMDYFQSECGSDVKCMIYKGVDPEHGGQDKFLEMLRASGYLLCTKPIKKIKDKNGVYHWKGNLDIELALDMVETKASFDTAVLVSGDSDFVPAIDRIKRVGKRIIVMSTRGHVAKELLERAKFLDLRKLKVRISQ